MIPQDGWLPQDWLAYINGWSFERIGSPPPPPKARGPESRTGAMLIIMAMPDHLRDGAIKDAMSMISPEAREGLFFDAGRIGARAA